MTLKRIFISTAAVVAFGSLTMGSARVDAQVIQLPTIRFFNVRTVVQVPDGGRIQTGGVNRYSSGGVSRGVPGLANLPYGGRLFRNRAIGGEINAGGTSVSTEIIVMSELEQEVLAEAERRRQIAARTDPNGSEAVQRKADFITRNIGRTKKR